MTVWTPVTIGGMKLAHRLVMAPMSRDRSLAGGLPSELNVEYYRQRASMAVIITEGTQPSEDGQGYLLTPGIHTDAHIAGWRKVTDAVHAEGGRIMVQLMHAGRVAHPDNTPHHHTPVAPSTVQPKGVMFTATGPQERPVPGPSPPTRSRLWTTSSAMRRFDGDEIHGGNGYLVHIQGPTRNSCSTYTDSGPRHWPTPTCPTASARAPRSTSPTPPPSTAATTVATTTTPPSPPPRRAEP
ncbi:hypothetical protein [Streptomyces sp. SID12488]|uniref:oxidoreductase n=1 Tax=Streptomyces sp. SID12488 TaxID=2706040 RepID=UPI0031BA905E